ncbi:hexose carrier protein HEX6-like [Andrographis paniculata]|uniref:hexose carrier protein HEX6-like n=1 Tax=Andrographis paniculata TaxID=175694 RepID=UPI0021E85CD9|nr:hexose carrier protein HEX6-like [Andrographis paniculata]
MPAPFGDISCSSLRTPSPNLKIKSSMAADDTDAAPRYHTRITCLVLLSCLMAATGGLLFGYDTGVTGGVTSMDAFLKKFFPTIYARMEEESDTTSNYCKFDSFLLTSFTASIYVSGFVASFVASRVTPMYGRKASILVGGIAFVAGAVLGGAAENMFMLLSGRLLLGVGIGFANQSVPLYLSEMAPPKYRGALNISFQVFVSFGCGVAFLINCATVTAAGDWGWRISLATATFPALILAVGAIFLPETPNSLIHRGRDIDEVETLLRKIRGADDVRAELSDLVAASRNAAAVKRPFKRILERRYRPHLVMSVAIPFFQQMTGINVITFYAPILFRTIGYGESAALVATVMISVIGTSMTALSCLIVDRLGRRTIFHIGGITMLVTQVAIGAIMAAELGDYGEPSRGSTTVILVLIYAYVASFGFSWGPLGWLVSSEIYPLEIRSAAQSISVGTNFFMSFVVGQTFLAMLCRLKAATFFFYGGWVAVMTVFVWQLLPETKNIPIEKMNAVWKKHSVWGRFVNDGGCEESSEEDGRIEEPLLR